MVTVQIEPTELEDIKLIAQKRHNAKDKSFRNLPFCMVWNSKI